METDAELLNLSLGGWIKLWCLLVHLSAHSVQLITSNKSGFRSKNDHKLVLHCGYIFLFYLLVCVHFHILFLYSVRDRTMLENVIICPTSL